MHVAVTRDVAGPAGARADRPQRLFHCRQHCRVLPHAEIIVRAPHRDLGTDAVIKGARKAASASLEIGKDAVASLGAQRFLTLTEELFLIHGAPCWLPLFWLRVSAGYLTQGGCGELVDRALHAIALPTAAHRGHLVIIGRLRLQTVYPHPENRLWMGPVEPDGRFRRLAQILGICTVVDDRKMLVISARVGAGPSDDGEVVVGNFELWRFGDLDVLGPLLRRRDLSDDWAGEEQAAGRGGDRQFQEQSIHRTDPDSRALEKKADGRNMGAHAAPHKYPGPMESRTAGAET